MKTTATMSMVLLASLVLTLTSAGGGKDVRFEEWGTVTIGESTVKVYGQPDIKSDGVMFSGWEFDNLSKFLSFVVELKGARYKGKPVELAYYDRDGVRLGTKHNLFELKQIAPGEKVRLKLPTSDPINIRTVKLSRAP